MKFRNKSTPASKDLTSHSRMLRGNDIRQRTRQNGNGRAIGFKSRTAFGFCAIAALAAGAPLKGTATPGRLQGAYPRLRFALSRIEKASSAS